MTENLEQKSSSGDTGAQAPETPKRRHLDVLVETMATPYRVVLWAEPPELRKLFDEYFEANEERIVHHFKVKSRKGKGGRQRDAQEMVEKHVPLSKLYSDCLTKLISEKLEASRPDQEILFIDGMEMFDFCDGNAVENPAQIVAVVYFIPKLEMKGEISHDIPRPVVPPEESEWERRLKEVQTQYRTVTADSDGEVTLSSNVMVDVHAEMMVSKEEDLLTQDDENWLKFDGGCLEGAWLEVKMIHVPEIQKGLLGHKKGDEFKVEFIGHKGTVAEGKRIRSEITIKDLQTITYPEINDEFAKDAGYADMADFRARFHTDYEKYKDNSLQMAATDHYIRQIMMNARIPPLPDNWIMLNVEKMIQDHLAQFRGDKRQAMLAMGTRDENSFKERFKGQLFRDFMQKLAVRHYAAMYGVDYKDQKAIIESMMGKANWIDPPQQEAK